MTAGQNHTHVSEHNRAVVLDLVRRSGPVTRSDIRDRTGLTAQTVSNITARLVADGLVHDLDRRLTLARDGRFAVGVHLDPAHVAVVLLDLAGGLVTEHQLGPADRTDPGATLDAMAQAVRDVIARSQVDLARVAGIGIAAPGPIERDGATLGAPAQLAAWAGFPLAAELARRTGLPAHVEKDVVASALAEWWTAPVVTDLVSVYLGHGVGAGIVVGGEVVRGHTGNAGEFGGMPVHAHGGWTALWQACQPLQQVRRGIDAGLLPPRIPLDDPGAVRSAFDDLCRAPGAAPLLAEAGSALGSALVHVVELLDLPRIVVGGSAALAAGPVLLEALTARLTERLAPASPPRVAMTTLGENVVARGAACAVLQASPTAPPRVAGTRGAPAAGRLVRTGGPARPRDIAHPW
ncbi:ROK family transcriptional regulator [Curtobacterium sp. VKM Ac-2922]|uniref:ROK family transcriptional regulator n=1 Tax=Curtobacterium sp. VKM Ac-2922 TaxID=2929475 RepID=UPI001FB1E7B3|nr:ROK family transcriptional regulator [Curtobacterium sp. VKM Ac-2922]MCJ1715495.1 ROK family transcriptional regulator [Curtobacterium sp. VKM Ac-2922]